MPKPPACISVGDRGHGSRDGRVEGLTRAGLGLELRQQGDLLRLNHLDPDGLPWHHALTQLRDVGCASPLCSHGPGVEAPPRPWGRKRHDRLDHTPYAAVGRPTLSGQEWNIGPIA
jgi:hypothetical protein